MNVCDMGAGSGVFAIIASKKGAIVTAIDVNPFSIMAINSNAASNFVEINSIHSNCFSSLGKKYFNYFDLIICNPPTIPDYMNNNKHDSINWNNNGNGRLVLDTMLLESIKYLKIGGKLIIASSSQQNWEKTKLLLSSHWDNWWVISTTIMELSKLYQQYADDWYKDGLIFKMNGKFFHEIKIIKIVA